MRDRIERIKFSGEGEDTKDPKVRPEAGPIEEIGLRVLIWISLSNTWLYLNNKGLDSKFDACLEYIMC